MSSFKTISPVPEVLNSKSALLTDVPMLLPTIKILSVENAVAEISPVAPDALATNKLPTTSKLLLITTSLSGISILPVPLARSSMSALVVVVVITLFSIFISSNCAD